MNNNNKQQQQQLGLVDNLAVDPSIKQTQDYLEADSRSPVDASSPSTTPLPYEANNEVLQPMAGTVLTDNIYQFTDQGVHTVREYSHNTSAKHEARMREEQQRVQASGRSIYQTPPSNGGFKPYVDVSEPPKPTEADLSQLRELERLRSINQRLKSLQRDEEVAIRKLANIQRAIHNLQLEVEDNKE